MISEPWSEYRCVEVARLLGISRARAWAAIVRAGLAHRGQSVRRISVPADAIDRVRAALAAPPRRRRRDTCLCCDGTGRVPFTEGELRPCSLCREPEFDAWVASRSAAVSAAGRRDDPRSVRVGCKR